MLPAEALGQNYAVARDRAARLNAFLDDWRAGRGVPKGIDQGARAGTVDWWIEHYERSEAFKRVSRRSQDDYREALQRLADLPTKLPDGATGRTKLVGELPVSSLSPAAVDKLYVALRQDGRVTRQANYTIDVARRAWNVVSRQYPTEFLIPNPASPRERIAINPFVGLLRVYGRGTTKPCTRAEAIALADALASLGHPALGFVALVSFEWLQRPGNVIAGYLTWTQYRPADRPGEVEIFHHKTGERIWHPLEDDNGAALYPELEQRLRALPRLGVSVVMLQPQRGPKTGSGQRPARLYSESYADHLVQKARKMAGLPDHVTFAACRHGGMTLLGDAGLTEQAVMVLSGHATPAAARLYVKRTEAQRLEAATQRRRHLENTGQAERTEGKSGNGWARTSGNGNRDPT
jgi:integrase